MGDSAKTVCPVCDEPFRDRPSRCFRCGTNLKEWWPLEELLTGPETLSVVPTALPSRKAYRRKVWIFFVAVIICVGSAGILFGRFALKPKDLSTPTIPTTHVTPPLPPTPFATPQEPTPVPTTQLRPEPASIPLAIPQVKPEIGGGGEGERVLRYRVQKGDSAWRIAAALTGAGQNWQLLWPELKDKPLRVGGVLEVRLKRLEASCRDKDTH